MGIYEIWKRTICLWPPEVVRGWSEGRWVFSPLAVAPFLSPCLFLFLSPSHYLAPYPPVSYFLLEKWIYRKEMNYFPTTSKDAVLFLPLNENVWLLLPCLVMWQTMRLPIRLFLLLLCFMRVVTNLIGALPPPNAGVWNGVSTTPSSIYSTSWGWGDNLKNDPN